MTSWTAPRPPLAASGFLPWVAGRFYTCPFGSGTNTSAPGASIIAMPIYVPNERGVTATSLGLEVTTLLASNNFRLAIFKDDAGQPGDLILDSGQLTTASTGFKSAVISQFLGQGWYWLALVSPAGTVAFRQFANSRIEGFFGALRGAEDVNAYRGYWTGGSQAVADIVANGWPGAYPRYSEQGNPGSTVVPMTTTNVLFKIMLGV